MELFFIFYRCVALLGGRTGEVHVGRPVRPGAEDERTELVVERVVSDVDLTHGLEGTARLPSDGAVVTEDGPEVAVALVHPLSPARRDNASH